MYQRALDITRNWYDCTEGELPEFNAEERARLEKGEVVRSPVLRSVVYRKVEDAKVSGQPASRPK